jgi:pimeloyl-ACP methyl ester carboxylesterase
VELQRTSVDVEGTTLSMLRAPVDGPVAVCLHGIPASAELWRDVLGALGAGGWQAVAPDLPGYGQTVPPDDADLSLEASTQVIAAWLSAMEGPAWIVGHDIGGVVAQHLATGHPGLVARLTLVNSVHTDNWPVGPIRIVRRLARLGLMAWLLRSPLFPDPYTKWSLRRTVANPALLDADTVARVFTPFASDLDAARAERIQRHVASLDNRPATATAARLGELTMPVQLIWGLQDPYQPWDPNGKKLAALVGDPRINLIEEAGHFVQLDAPGTLAEHLLDFAGRPTD